MLSSHGKLDAGLHLGAAEEIRVDPLLGQLVADRYTIEAQIGMGGMGTVYSARQSGLDRSVALKILKDEVSWDPDTVTRFHREAKAMSLLVHPNTVRVFDFGQTKEGMLYLAMELLEGELLSEKIEREVHLDVREAIGVIQQILGSLSEAHSKGIVHRDLKPDNIYLAQVDGHDAPVVKVLDFGIAKVVHGDIEFDQLETQHGTVFGTPRYMSPEQAQGKGLDPRSDLYSIGVLLYHLLTGEPPFQDEDAVVVMAKHIRDKPQRPRDVAPERPIPPSLDRLVMKAVEKSPSKRFDDADGMIKALSGCLADVATENSHLRTVQVWRKMQRLPRRTYLGAGLLVALCAAIAIGILVYNTPDDAVPTLQATSPLASLTSDPEGADVFFGSEWLGKTPLQMPLEEGETRDVVLKMDGFTDTTAEVIADGVSRSVKLANLPTVVERLVEAKPQDTAGTMRKRVRRIRKKPSTENTLPPVMKPTVMETKPKMSADPYGKFE